MYSLKRFTSGVISQRLGEVGGAVWQEGCFDRALRSDEDVVAMAAISWLIRCGLGFAGI